MNRYSDQFLRKSFSQVEVFFLCSNLDVAISLRICLIKSLTDPPPKINKGEE